MIHDSGPEADHADDLFEKLRDQQGEAEERRLMEWMETTDVCAKCKGTGVYVPYGGWSKRGPPEECKICKGTGRVPKEKK